MPYNKPHTKSVTIFQLSAQYCYYAALHLAGTLLIVPDPSITITAHKLLTKNCRNIKTDRKANSVMPNLSFLAFNVFYGKVGRNAFEECVLALLQAKCLLILLYGAEACLLLSCDRQSFKFTVNCLFIKNFWTVVRKCQQNFNFLPTESQLEIRTAKFLQVFSVTKNTL